MEEDTHRFSCVCVCFDRDNAADDESEDKPDTEMPAEPPADVVWVAGGACAIFAVRYARWASRSLVKVPR